MESACFEPRLFRDSYKSFKNQPRNFSFWVGVSKPQIAYRFHSAGTGQIGLVHGCQMIVQEASSITGCSKNQIPIGRVIGKVPADATTIQNCASLFGWICKQSTPCKCVNKSCNVEQRGRRDPDRILKPEDSG